MTYSLQAKHAAAAALIAIQRETISSKADFDEALTAALSTIVHAMILEGAPPAVIEGAVHTGTEWAGDASDEVLL